MTEITFTREDLRSQVEQYLAKGAYSEGYDVTGIVDMIIKFHGLVPWDSLPEVARGSIMLANDIGERYE